MNRKEKIKQFIDYIDREVEDFFENGRERRIILRFAHRRIELSFDPEVIDALQVVLKTELELLE